MLLRLDVKMFFFYRLSLIVGLLISCSSLAGEIALTFDDAPTVDSSLMTGEERSAKLVQALQAAQVPDALFFVTTKNLDAKTGKRLRLYTDAGFHLANHSHLHLSANKSSIDAYMLDIYKAHLQLKPFTNVLPYHRFPFLHYGADQQAIDRYQELLNELGYKSGYVTVDNFDWYINALLVKAVEQEKTIDYDKVGQLYVDVLWQSIKFYDQLAKKALGRSPKHVLLLHENDVAALYVTELIAHIRKKGWRLISPQEAYQDPIAKTFPATTFHKQGRVAAIAHSQGLPEVALRHPSENTQFLDDLFKKNAVFK